MLNCSIYGQKALKMEKICHISVRDFASNSMRFTKCVVTFAEVVMSAIGNT